MNLGWRVHRRDPHRRGEPRAMAHGHRRRDRRAEGLVRAVRRRLGSALASLHRARRSARRRRSGGRSLFKPRWTARIFSDWAVRTPRHTRRWAPPDARCSEAPRWVGRWYRSRRAAPRRISRERGAARPRPRPRSPARRRTTARDPTRLGRSTERVYPRLARRTARRGDGRRRPPSSRDRPRPTPRPRPRSRAIA